MSFLQAVVMDLYNFTILDVSPNLPSYRNPKRPQQSYVRNPVRTDTYEEDHNDYPILDSVQGAKVSLAGN